MFLFVYILISPETIQISPVGSYSFEHKKQVTPPDDLRGGRIEPQLGQKPGVIFIKSSIKKRANLSANDMLATLTKNNNKQIGQLFVEWQSTTLSGEKSNQLANIFIYL